MHLAWTTDNGAAALAIGGLTPDAIAALRSAPPDRRSQLLRVLPAEALGADRAPMALPGTAGSLAVDGADPVFVPRFGFVAGCRYAVVAHPRLGAGPTPTIEFPAPRRVPATVVEAIHPAAAELPVNALRLYIRFSAPMAEGFASHVRVLDQATGAGLDGALLPMAAELWDPPRTRLTVLFDPGRIKQGLVPHEQAGYPLREGGSVRVEVSPALHDATGAALATGAHRDYQVGPPLHGRVDPDRWVFEAPPAGTRLPLVVRFDRPLDHALLQHALTVEGVRGVGADGPGGESWRFVPDAPWRAGPQVLAVASILEDIAGNSVARPFDRDLSAPDGHTPVPPVVRRPFAIPGPGEPNLSSPAAGDRAWERGR